MFAGLSVLPFINDSLSRRSASAQSIRRVCVPAKPEVSELGAEAGRLLYGGLPEAGLSLKWHDFNLSADLDWARGFHPKCLELCLNLWGKGRISSGREAIEFEDKTCGFYLPGKYGLQASRQSEGQQQFLTITFSAAYLRKYLSACDGALHPLVDRFMQKPGQCSGLSRVRRLTTEQEQMAARLLRPPVPQAARSLWYQSQVLQLMTDFFFERSGEDELFCDRQKRVARERADGVIAILRRQLAEPLGLEAIAREVGCSPFYLSRTFSQETGMTIPRYLRKLRMERAAELLRSGKYNVTEAAMEVGYSSLSHFSQAFCQTMGCCPALYPVRERVSQCPPQPSVKE